MTNPAHPQIKNTKWIALAIAMVVGINACLFVGHLSLKNKEGWIQESFHQESGRRRLDVEAHEIDILTDDDDFEQMQLRLDSSSEDGVELETAQLSDIPPATSLRRRLQEESVEGQIMVNPEMPSAEPRPFVSRDNYLGVVFPEPEKMPMFLRNTMMPLDEDDLIFFWHIPKTAGVMMKVIMGTCFGFRRAEKLKHPASLEMVKDTVLNVDTATPAGIEQAQEFNIADSGMVDLIISPFVLSASSLFTYAHHGRAFTIIRHPVDTAASNFNARKSSVKAFRKLGLNLVDYVAQDWYPDNFMVRQLTGVLPGLELTRHHMDLAKHLLSAKFFIGVYEQMEETMRQLRVYYGWQELPGKEGCAVSFIRGADPQFTPTSRPKPKKGSDGWYSILEKEKWDLELYYFGLELFSKQAVMYPSAAKPASPFADS